MQQPIPLCNTFLDGRRVSICFTHDVTERNTLRRLLFDRAELERRQLAAELREALSGPLAELRIVAHKLRVRAMGARLWERTLGASHTRLICDYPL